MSVGTSSVRGVRVVCQFFDSYAVRFHLLTATYGILFSWGALLPTELVVNVWEWVALIVIVLGVLFPFEPL